MYLKQEFYCKQETNNANILRTGNLLPTKNQYANHARFATDGSPRR